MAATTEDLAREALGLVEVDPRRAAVLAAQAMTGAHQSHEKAAESVAARAQGLAAFYLEDLDASVAFLRIAIRLGRQARSTQLAAEARMTLAFVLMWRGRSATAIRMIDSAVGVLHGVNRARAHVQRGAILQQAGRFDEALVDYRTGLPVLRKAHDDRWAARVYVNRGLGRAHRGQFVAAEKDIRNALRLWDGLNLALSVAIGIHNLGYVQVLRGNVPSALAYFDQAETRFRQLGSQVSPLLRDRAELLLSVRLVSEAREAAERAITECLREQRHSILPEARLLLARAEQLGGDVGGALQQARTAARELDGLGHAELAALARVLVLTYELTGDSPRIRTAELERAIAGTGGLWPDVALEARLVAGQRELDRGRADRAVTQLSQAGLSRRRGAATLRARAWYAQALLHQAAGNRAAARSAARTGLRILDDHAAAIAATDMRAHVAGHRVDLASLGLGLAIEDGSARQAFAWAEIGRASHLHNAPAGRQDEALSDALSELRIVTRDIDESRTAGRPTGALRARQVGLERQIRDHQRRQRASHLGVAVAPSVADLSAALRGAAVVEYVALGEQLRVITVVDGHVRMRELGPWAPVLDLADRLPFALHRLARRSASKPSREAAHSLLRATVAELDRMLLGSAPNVGDRPLLVVPTGRLQWLPWSVLPSCAGRPVTVAPSATLWHGAITRRARRGAVVVAAGPGLPGARAEAEAVASIYGVKPLVGEMATVESVAANLDGAALAHLATHGRVRADNPQFGSLSLADGPLMIYDLEKLRRTPHTVVVAACDAGRPVVPVGDELLGLTASLLAQGTSQLVASVLPILDTETWPLMVAFHDRLRGGETVATALASAQLEVASRGFEGMATAAGFLCFGAGFTRPNVARGTR
jgi:tetratricopeptide (TPR) repeat protein